MTVDYIRALNFFIKTLGHIRAWRFIAILVGIILYTIIAHLPEILNALKDFKAS